jgi:hypothetical protein
MGREFHSRGNLVEHDHQRVPEMHPSFFAFVFRLPNPVRVIRLAVMPEFTSSTVVILLASLLGVALLGLLWVAGISRTLLRIERRLAEQQSASRGAELPPSSSETSAGGAFETFLSEDPARRKLTKAEQFAEYRKWRQENGLNWSNS